MLYWALVFLIVALVAGALGFGGIAGVATGIAKVLFFVFLIAFVISLVMGRRAISCARFVDRTSRRDGSRPRAAQGARRGWHDACFVLERATRRRSRRLDHGRNEFVEGGFLDKLKGRLKEAAGSLKGDEELKRSGRADQTAGAAKESAEEAVDKAKDALTGSRDA